MCLWTHMCIHQVTLIVRKISNKNYFLPNILSSLLNYCGAEFMIILLFRPPVAF